MLSHTFPTGWCVLSHGTFANVTSYEAYKTLIKSLQAPQSAVYLSSDENRTAWFLTPFPLGGVFFPMALALMCNPVSQFDCFFYFCLVRCFR